MQRGKSNGFVHVEAYKLMKYRCNQCGFHEVIWNSRDGVTPFITRCPKCGGEEQHVEWQRDKLAMEHIPHKGQRVFIDLPTSLKYPLALRRIQSFVGTPYEVKDEDRKEILSAILEDFKSDQPFIIVWEFEDI